MAFYSNVLMYYNHLRNAEKMQTVTLPNQTQVDVYSQNNLIYKTFRGLLLLLQMLKDNHLSFGRPSMSTTLQGVNIAAERSAQLDSLSKLQLRSAFKKKDLSVPGIGQINSLKNSKFLI